MNKSALLVGEFSFVIKIDLAWITVQMQQTNVTFKTKNLKLKT